MQRVLLALIRAYQLTLSPIVGYHCRFTPSCSRYATEAIQLHGSARGTWLAIRRIARCHPFCEGGLDPVPRPAGEAPPPDLPNGQRTRERREARGPDHSRDG